MRGSTFRTGLIEEERQALLKLPDLDARLQVAVTGAGAPRLRPGPPEVHLLAWPDQQACDAVAAEPSQPCSLARLLEMAAQQGVGVQLASHLYLSPVLVARLRLGRVLEHQGGCWLVEFCPSYPGRTLRDLLALRSERELPALQVWRALCLEDPQREERWLLSDAPLSDGQRQRCKAAGYRHWSRTALEPAQPELAALAAGQPPTRMDKAPAPASGNAAALVLLILAALVAGTFWKAHTDRQQPIALQQGNAGRVLAEIFEGSPRRHLDPLFEGLVRLGVPASVGGQLIDMPSPDGLDGEAQRVALRSVLGRELGARLQSFEALEAYLQAQAQRIGQRRMVLSGEYCRYRLGVVLPLLANRNFVVTVEAAPGHRALRWSGVEHIDARELDACWALGLPRLD